MRSIFLVIGETSWMLNPFSSFAAGRHHRRQVWKECVIFSIKIFHITLNRTIHFPNFIDLRKSKQDSRREGWKKLRQAANLVFICGVISCILLADYYYYCCWFGFWFVLCRWCMWGRDCVLRWRMRKRVVRLLNSSQSLICECKCVSS